MFLLQAFLPDMIKHKLGHIVNVASLAGHSGTNKLVDYCSSKFAAVGLDEALRVELFVQGLYKDDSCLSLLHLNRNVCWGSGNFMSQNEDELSFQYY